MTSDQEAVAALYNRPPDEHLRRAAVIAVTNGHENQVQTELLWAIAKSTADDYQGTGNE